MHSSSAPCVSALLRAPRLLGDAELAEQARWLGTLGGSTCRASALVSSPGCGDWAELAEQARWLDALGGSSSRPSSISLPSCPSRTEAEGAPRSRADGLVSCWRSAEACTQPAAGPARAGGRQDFLLANIQGDDIRRRLEMKFELLEARLAQAAAAEAAQEADAGGSSSAPRVQEEDVQCALPPAPPPREFGGGYVISSTHLPDRALRGCVGVFTAPSSSSRASHSRSDSCVHRLRSSKAYNIPGIDEQSRWPGFLRGHGQSQHQDVRGDASQDIDSDDVQRRVEVCPAIAEEMQASAEAVAMLRILS